MILTPPFGWIHRHKSYTVYDSVSCSIWFFEYLFYARLDWFCATCIVQMNAEDKLWSTVWPTYLNSTRTVVQGRRIPKSKAIENPRWQEIKDVLEATKDFTVLADGNKVYPRELDKEIPYNRGRVKYQSTNPKYQSKKDVLLYLAEMIPKLKSRAKGAPGTSSTSIEQPANQQSSKNKKKARKWTIYTAIIVYSSINYTLY